MTSVLTSMTSYYIATDEPSDGETENSKQQAASDARQNFLTDMNTIFEQILGDKASIRPMTYIPAGTRIIIYPQVDLWLRSIERDQEASVYEEGEGVGLLDGREGQRGKGERKVSGSGGQVVYDEQGNVSEPEDTTGVLIAPANKKKQQRVVPPPPVYSGQQVPMVDNVPRVQSSGGGYPAPSGSSPITPQTSSNDEVPQLF